MTLGTSMKAAKVTINLAATMEKELDLNSVRDYFYATVESGAVEGYIPQLTAAFALGGGQPGGVNYHYPQQYTLTANGTQDIDLGNLTDAWNQPFAFNIVRGILVRIQNKQVGQYVTLSKAPADGWVEWLGNATIKVQKVKMELNLGDGWAVPLSANQTMRITNGPGFNTAVDFVVVGEGIPSVSILMSDDTAILDSNGTPILMGGYI